MSDGGHVWWEDAVVYEVYPRSFADADGDGVGDLPGLRSRLGYLADLGVDAIWVTPFYPSPLADGGYDVSDYCAVDPALDQDGTAGNGRRQLGGQGTGKACQRGCHHHHLQFSGRICQRRLGSIGINPRRRLGPGRYIRDEGDT